MGNIVAFVILMGLSVLWWESVVSSFYDSKRQGWKHRIRTYWAAFYIFMALTFTAYTFSYYATHFPIN